MGKKRPLHERVASVVESSGISRDDLIAKTGWDEQRAYRLLTGRTRLTGDDVELLAEVIGKPVGALYRGAQ